MSAEQNKIIVSRFIGALDKLDEIILDELVAPNFRLNSSMRSTSDRETWKRAAKEARNIIPDLHLTVEDLVAERDEVVARFRETGTHKGDLFGVSGTGKRISISTITIFKLQEGKIVEAWQNIDVFAIMQQLDLVPTPRRHSA